MLRISDFGFRISCFGFRSSVSGFRFRFSGFGSGFQVSDFGFPSSGFAFGLWLQDGEGVADVVQLWEGRVLSLGLRIPFLGISEFGLRGLTSAGK